MDIRPGVRSPIDLEVLGKGIPRSSESASQPCVAMLICHGMGQQVPFETLDAAAKAIIDEHMTQTRSESAHGRSAEAVVRFVRPSNTGRLLPRAELTLKEHGQEDKRVHLYEAYWAPLTEGVITYTQTALRLVAAGFRGWWSSVTERVFRRWLFEQERDLPIDPQTLRLLTLLLIIAAPILAIPVLSAGYLRNLVHDGILNWWVAAGAVFAVAGYFIRYFVVEYMGDVIIYVSSNEVNAFWKVRDEIKQIGLSLAEVVYGAVGRGQSATPKTPGAPHFLYSKVVVVGHSLGSVVAYDTLNAIINEDELDESARKVVERTEALVTFGSPLDKTAFLFRQKAKDNVTRNALAGAHQPMIVNYKYRPKWWINIFCEKDIISGSLEYYDDPDVANTEQRRVRNYADPCDTSNPERAHTGYWDRGPTRAFLYHAATDSLQHVDSASFRHANRHVPIRMVKQERP